MIENSGVITATEAPSVVRTMRRASWVAFTIICFLFFTLINLPQERLKNYIQGSISAALSPYGISFTAGKSRIAFGLGLAYVMEDVALNFPPPATPVHIDQLSFSPSILPLLLGRTGGTLSLEQGSGRLSGSFWTRKSDFSADLGAKNLDLGKLGAFAAIQVAGSAIFNGSASLRGDLTNLSTLSGNVAVDLSRIVVDDQSIAGFAVPKLTISEGRAEGNIEKGRFTIKTLRLGKPGSVADDLRGTGTGDILLGKQIEMSTLNLKLNFSLSEKLLKAFVLIDALLGPGKQPDGSYNLLIQGTFSAPNVVPGGKG